MFSPHDDPDGDCVLRRLLRDEPARAAVPWPVGFEGGLAHRLDTGTSGALALADDVADLEFLRGLFARGSLVKTYRLVVARDPGWDDHVCERPIAHDPRRRWRMVVQRGASTPHRGKWLPARTAFRRVHETLFEATMSTGVMHQIRVHAAFLGIPLAGDARYGGGEGSFRLHHMGFRGPDGLTTAAVPLPDWASAPSDRSGGSA